MTQLEPSNGSAKCRRWRARGWRGLLIVTTIVAIPLVGPRVLSYLGESKVKAAKIQIQSFASALDLFHRDVGRYPSTSEGLGVLVKPVPGLSAWDGPYVKGGSVPNDPWGRPYVYQSPGKQAAYDIILKNTANEDDVTPMLFD
jgi:general secretion pathway protein G